MEAKEITKNQPSSSPQDKDGAEPSSENDQTREGEEKSGSEDEAKEQNTSETGPSGVLSDSVTAQQQPESENSTSNDEDKDMEKDKALCKRDGEGEKSTSDGEDESDESRPSTGAEEIADSDDHNKRDSDGTLNATQEESVVEQEKEKERPVIVSNVYSSAAVMNVCLYVSVPFPFQNPSQCWWLSVTKWAVENKLGPNLVEYVNNEFSTNDDPYRTTKIK